MLEAINAFVKQKQNRGVELGDLEKSLPNPNRALILQLSPPWQQKLNSLYIYRRGNKIGKETFFFFGRFLIINVNLLTLVMYTLIYYCKLITNPEDDVLFCFFHGTLSFQPRSHSEC